MTVNVEVFNQIRGKTDLKQTSALWRHTCPLLCELLLYTFLHGVILFLLLVSSQYVIHFFVHLTFFYYYLGLCCGGYLCRTVLNFCFVHFAQFVKERTEGRIHETTQNPNGNEMY